MIDTEIRRADRHDTGKRRWRGVIILLSIILVLGILALIMGRIYINATGASGPRDRIVLDIPPGSDGAAVADLLVRTHVVRSAWGFKLLAKFKHSGDFEAGRYTNLTTNMTVSEALTALAAGPSVVLKTSDITVPEGFNVKQTGLRMGAGLQLTTKAFVESANGGSYSLPPYLPAGTDTVEGFLFPETYQFYDDATPDDVIKKMLDQFKTEADTIGLIDKAKALHVTPYQLVVIASMVEKEAKFDVDRPKVAEVIYNRLKKGMPLQIDATIQYALGHVKPKLTDKDLQVDSPYNTYLHTGLPPAPIASPGLESLMAALSPTHDGYLYFVVTDAAGHETFTASYAEFLRLKALQP